MEGKLYKSPNGEHYYLTVDGKIFAEIDGHPLKSINQALSFKNCQAIENGYDLIKLVEENSKYSEDDWGDGFLFAINLMSDKKFSINEVVELCKILMSNPFEKCGKSYQELTDNYIQSLQPKEWDVEIEMEKYVKYVPKALETVYPTLGIRPKLDADSCLILKRI